MRQKGYASADFELQFPILRGRPRKPDIAFSDGGTHIISGKLGESKEFDAFSTAQEYQQLIGATTTLGEVFGVVYPSTSRESFILHLLANPNHERRVWRTHEFAEIVDIICEAVQQRLDYLEKGMEPPDASVIRLLRQGVIILHHSARKAQESQLKGVFGGTLFFDSVLSKDVPVDVRSDFLSQASAYLFINQLLFYHILRRKTKLFPKIELADMTSPAGIRRKYFSLVLEKDYEPIFKFDVSNVFDPEKCKDGCLRVARLIEELSRSISADDLIGKVFHEIIPLEFRKLIAAFYTNSAAGDLLAGLSIDRQEASVLDPACGSGTLLVSSYKRKRVLASKMVEKRELHKQFLENDITGLDAMAFSAHLAAIHLVLQEPSVYTENLRIGTTDSTFARPGIEIKTFGATIRQAFRQRNLASFETGEHLVKEVELTEAGAVRLKGQVNAGFTLDKVDLVIMNPPFTSSRRLSADYKDDLKKWFRSNSRYRRIIKGNISYQAYFMCLADKFLEDGGRIAAVLPFTTLIGGDFSELTKFLVNSYSIDYIIMGKGRLAFSENTYFTEVLFVARKGAPNRNEKSLLVHTKTSPALWKEKEVESMIALLRKTKEHPMEVETDMCEVIPFDQKELLPQNKTLTGLVADFDKEYRQLDKRIKRIIDEQEKVTTFSKLVKDTKLDVTVAEVVHGKSRSGPGHSLTRFGGDALVICRSEDRALMKHDRLIFKEESPRLIRFFDKQTGDEFSMAKSNVKGALRRFAYFEYIDATDREDFVISGYDDRLEDIYDKIYGSVKSVGYLKDVKEEWRKVVEKGTATVCVPGRMNLAAPGTKILALRSKNDMFMCSFMWGISGLSPLEEKILVLWINSALFMHYLLTHHTVTGGSWVKLHSKQMMKMPLPSFKKLTKQERSELGKLYTKLKDVAWTSLYEQYSAPTDERIELDSTFLRLVGFNRKDIESIREDLYRSIIRTFDRMRDVMKAAR